MPEVATMSAESETGLVTYLFDGALGVIGFGLSVFLGYLFNMANGANLRSLRHDGEIRDINKKLADLVEVPEGVRNLERGQREMQKAQRKSTRILNSMALHMVRQQGAHAPHHENDLASVLQENMEAEDEEDDVDDE